MWCELVQKLREDNQPVPNHSLHMATMECRLAEGKDIWPFTFPPDSPQETE